MALDTLYQVRSRQKWYGSNKELENVWFFDHTAGTGSAADLAVDFGTVYAPAINALQTNTVSNYSIDVINLGDLADFESVPWTGLGTYDGEALPPYAAVGFTLKVNTRAVRKGSKRISGVPETVGSNGVITNATYQGYMEDLRVIMQTELVSAGDTWLPVVVKRVKTAVSGTTPTQYTYRLPTIGETPVVGEVVVALTSNDLSHQVSREV